LSDVRIQDLARNVEEAISSQTPQRMKAKPVFRLGSTKWIN
jgi:hypothetical protein